MNRYSIEKLRLKKSFIKAFKALVHPANDVLNFWNGVFFQMLFRDEI